ncbi:MAG: efflux RND transporter permease subunit, partial [Pseudomonadales bacterium]
MQALVRFFVERHLLVNLFAASLVVLGLISAVNLQREFLPSFSAPLIWVTATLPGASARDVETKITIPLEDAIDGIEGVDEFYTVISDNSSFTTIELYDDYSAEEIAESERDIRNAIEGVTDFPQEMDDEPVVQHLKPGRGVVVEVALTGPPEQLNTVAEELERRIERLDSVSNVTLIGLPDPELRVLVDPARALEHSVTLVDIISAIERRNVSSTGGNLESASNQRQVVMWSRYQQPQDVGDTILKFSNSGGAVRVRDIARIESGREDTRLLVHNNGKRGITLLINKRETADIIDAATDVRTVMSNTSLPDGVNYRLLNDESFIISNRLKLMATNGMMGAVLVAIVLFSFVRLQPAIWILIGIPVVFLGAIAVFGRFDLSLNIMSLTAFVIVLGMVVDDAVVVSERIVFKQAQGLSRRDAAVAGTLEMMPAVTAAALTTILAFLPMIALGGLPGKITWQIPAVVVMALLVSAIESFFVLPAHMSTVSADAKISKRVFVVRLEQAYRQALKHVLRHRVITLLVALLAFFFIMLVIRPAVPFILFPQDDAERLYVKITAPLGTPLEQTEAAVVQIERQIMQITADDLDGVMARIGHQNSASANKVIGEASNEALIIVQFKAEGRQYTNAEWIQVIQAQLNLPNDISVVFQSDYFGPPTDQPVTIHVLSNAEQTRRGVAFEIASFLESIPGVIEVEIDERPGTPQIDLNLDFEKLALRGLDAHSVGLTLNAAFYGIEASEHRDLNDTTALRVMFEPAARNNLEALLETPIRAADGNLLRLRDVVKPSENPAVTRIYHRDGYRSATIRASFTPTSGLTALPFA